MKRVWLLLLAAFSPALLSAWRPLYDGDSVQYAEVARHLLLSGKWGSLEDEFGGWLNKPPLDMWLMAASMRVFGVNSFGSRVPSLLLGLILLGLTFRLGERLFDRRTGQIAAVFVATSVAFQIMVADPKIDLLLVTCVTATVLCAVDARWPSAGIAAGFGFLAKGPVGVLIPAFAVVPETIAARRWPKPLPFLLGIVLCAAMAAGWLWLQFPDWGWGGVKHHLWDQAGGRLGQETIWHNAAGPLFFVHTSLWAFLPFVALVPVALWRQFREKGPARMLVGWFALTFLVISTASYKLPQYLFPILPAAALLAARGLKPWAEWLGIGLGAAVLALAAFVLGWCFPPSALVTAAWLLGLAGAILLGWLGARFLERPERTAGMLAVPLFAFAVFYQAYFYPAMLAFQPGERIGRLARQLDPAGSTLPEFGVETGNAPGFYAQRGLQLTDEAALRKVVEQGQTQLALLGPDAGTTLAEHGWNVETVGDFETFEISKPTKSFLLASSRPGVLQRILLARVRPPQ